MRILHVLGKLDRGGVETWLLQVLRHIDRQKYQMDFLVHASGPGAYDDQVRGLGSRILRCPQPQHLATYCRNFCRAIRRFGPYDVVHSHVHHFSGVVLALSAAMGVKIRVAHAHNDTRSREERASRRRQAYLAAMRHAIAATATAGLAVSRAAGDSLYPRDWLSGNRWEVSHLGTDLSCFDHRVGAVALRRELGIPGGSLVVGHVGRFDAQKNHDFLVNIAVHCVASRPNVHFLLVGDGPLRPSVEQEIRDSGLQTRFHLLGLRDDVPRLMCGAMDLFLFPSHHEGLPIALLEAQAAGLPCLVSDTVTRECDAIAELIEHESLQTGADGWAHRLCAMADRRRMAPAEVRGRLSYWSIEASIDRLLTFYERRLTHRSCQIADVSAHPLRSVQAR